MSDRKQVWITEDWVEQFHDVQAVTDAIFCEPYRYVVVFDVVKGSGALRGMKIRNEAVRFPTMASAQHYVIDMRAASGRPNGDEFSNFRIANPVACSYMRIED